MKLIETCMNDKTGYFRGKSWTMENGKKYTRIDFQQYYTNRFYSFYFVNGVFMKEIRKS